MRKRFTVNFFHVILIVAISVMIGYWFGGRDVALKWKDYKPIVSVDSKAPPGTQSLDLRLLYEVVDRVNNDYYDKTKIDTKKMLYGAVSGMLQSLDDPYTSFFPPKQNSEFKTQLSGEFSGIGAELGLTDDKKITVVSPLDDSPAKKAGIKSGDIIHAVNGESTIGWDIGRAVERIRGKKGTTVKLLVQHENEKSTKDVTIVRDTIKIDSVTSWVKSIECSGESCKEIKNCPVCSKVAYMRISQFGDRTNEEWIARVNTLYTEISNDKNVKGIVLDLRNNPGGYLNDAVFIASEFIKSGVVVMQEDGTGSRLEMKVSRDGILLDRPLVVLINKGSASASEIVAGALRDHKRAILVGENSFGKGTVQQAVDVDNGASIHISVAKWLTPNGTWVHKKGLVPDILVAYDEKKSDKNGFDNQLMRAIKELVK